MTSEGTWRRRFPLASWETAGVAMAAVFLALILALAGPGGSAWPTGMEAFCYWVPGLSDPYVASNWTASLAYVYSPAFLQALAPLKILPWPQFLAIWTVGLLLAVRWLSGPRLWAAAIVFATLELAGGNIHLLLAVAIVAGFRWPAAWAVVLLTKVTPGIGLLWFAVRREWGNLAIALGATAFVVIVSFMVAPQAWADWTGVLLASAAKTTGTWTAVPVPLAIRLPAAVAIVVWGARTDRRWTVPIAAMLALPALWFGGLAMLLAVIPLRERAAPQRAPSGSAAEAARGPRLRPMPGAAQAS